MTSFPYELAMAHTYDLPAGPFLQLLRQWTNLSRANRPRVLWVAGRCLELAPHSDEAWELCTKALHDVLCR
jgi:hypothetical protein